MKLILTAFEPFGGETVNPAMEAVALVSGQIGETEVVKLTVPTSFRRCVPAVAAAVGAERPDAVLCVGQAGGRGELTPERVAINMDDAGIPDNDGDMPVERPIRPDGPAAYFSTLPVKAMAAAIREAGLPAGVSNTAGTFVCNHLMYGLLDLLARDFPGVLGGFLHIPFAPCQTLNRPGVPSMEPRDAAAGIEAAVRAVAAVRAGRLSR